MSYAPKVPLQIDWASPAANNAILYYKYNVKGSVKVAFQEVRTGPPMRTYFHESFALEAFVQSNQQKLQYEGGKEATDFSSGTIQKVILYSQEGYAKRRELESSGIKFDDEDGYCQELKKQYPRQCPKQNYEFQGVYHPPDPTEANTPKILTVTVTGGQALPPAPAPAPKVVHAPAPAPRIAAPSAPQPVPGMNNNSSASKNAAQMLASPAMAYQQASAASAPVPAPTPKIVTTRAPSASTANDRTNANQGTSNTTQPATTTTTTTTTTSTVEKSSCCIIL